MPQLRLYIDRFWISPYSFSAYVALREKDLSFELVELGLDRRDQKQGDYVRGSLTGRIPALQDGSFWLAESNAIFEYLDEAYPNTKPLLPRSLQQRARARMLMGWIRTDLNHLRKEISSETMFFDIKPAPLSADAHGDIQRLFDVVNTLLGGAHKEFIFDEWCIVDAELSFMLHRLIRQSINLPAYIQSYAEANWKRDSTQEFIQHQRPSFVPY